MPIFWNEGFTNHKGTESHAFTAGQNLGLYEFVKRSAPGSFTVVSANLGDPIIGYVLSTSRGVLAGERVEIMMGEWKEFSGGAGGAVLSINSITGNGLLGTELQFVNDLNAPGANFHYGTDALGVKGWYPDASGLTDVLIGNTMHVASNGNDGTAIPNSLVYKYATINAAVAASAANDLIVVWPGSYIVPTQIEIDGVTASRFYFFEGTGIITPPSGSRMFNVHIGQRLAVGGKPVFLARDEIFGPNDPTTDICYIDFEATQILQFGANPYFGDCTSMSGSIRVIDTRDMSLSCDGWTQIDFCIDYSGTTGAAKYSLGSIVNNNGLGFNTVYGVARFQVRGYTGRYAHFYAAFGDNDGVFETLSGGTKDDRIIKVQADIYAFNCAGFRIAEGTVIWEGHGILDRDITLDQNPFFDFRLDSVDFSFEHRGGGTVYSDLDNTMMIFTNNGTVKLSGKYKGQGDTFSLFEYYEPSVGNKLIINGDMKVDTNFPAILFFYNGIVPMELIFEQASCEMVAGGDFMINNNGIPFGFRVNHSLVTNSGYDIGTNTDTSLGNRHYIDRRFTNFITKEMSAQ